MKRLVERLHGWRRAFASWLLRDVHLSDVHFGRDSLTMGPNGWDILRWTSTGTPSQLGDFGMDITTGRPQAFIGGGVVGLMSSTEGIASVGATPLSKVERIAQAGPGSYAAGGFTATFGNLTTLQAAVIAHVQSAQFVFEVASVATNVATIKCFRRLPSHTHDFLIIGGRAAADAIVRDGTVIGKVAGGNVTIASSGANGGPQATSSDAALEEVANGTVLSGTTLILLGFGT